MRELNIDDDAVSECVGPLDLGGLWALHELDRPDLKDEPWTPVTQTRLVGPDDEPVDFFAVMSESDVLVHHPYDSFATSVEEFIRQAARDPKVQAIKLTLYRTSGDSPIIKSLIRAAERGKQVAALVELKARFDEAANIVWARALEEAGVHVTYGLVGLKTHTKIALVVRDEADGIHRYCHIGTGNYNPKTAKLYEDVGLLTADELIGADLTHLFNFLTGYGRNVRYRKLLVAPGSLRHRLERLIRNEMEAPQGTGRIKMKMNSLVDPTLIDVLYEASEAGVEIDLIVAGHLLSAPRRARPVRTDPCSVHRRSLPRALADLLLRQRRGRRRPGATTSGRLTSCPATSTAGSKHSLPSSRRICRQRLQEILDVNLADDTLAWRLGPDGGWQHVERRDTVDTHRRLQELALARATRRPVVAALDSWAIGSAGG